jgi:hypothetical protein
MNEQAAGTIRYPPEYHPGRTHVFVRNELAMNVPPDRVWAWLIRATLWPSWYRNSAHVRIEGGGPDLAPGIRFRWKTFGIRLVSRVEEFIPNERIAWTARAPGVLAYHAWLIEPQSAGCHVVTEETQSGWLARLGHLVMPNRMSKYHQLWLEQLQVRAAGGRPG